MADNVLSNVLGEGYQEVNAVQNGNAVYKNGKLQYFKIDIDQPGKYFFNLTDAFNASVDESNKIIPIQFVRGGGYLPLNGFNVSMDGIYPNGTTEFHVVGETQGANPAFINFNMPLGMFQAVGPYRFQFTITNTSTGEILKSPFQFFDVSQTSTNLAVDLSNGIKPFDSEYTEWKNKVEQQINQLMGELNNLGDAATQLKGLMNQYVSEAEGYVDSAFAKCLQQENTWTAKQHFNGGITFGNNALGNNLVANEVDTENLTANGNVKLPNTTLVNGEFELGNVLRLDKSADGGHTTFLNATKAANASIQSWLWGERYNKELDRTNNPHFYLYMAFALDCTDIGKPFAQFATDFFDGCNTGPITIPIGAGSAMFHVDSDSDTLILDSVSNISGKVTVGTKIWI